MKKMRRHMTLMEIMIVIVLIGLIGGVIAYNMRGSLEEGRIFKTEQGGAQVYNILMLEVAKGYPLDSVTTNWQETVSRSPMAKNPKELIKDGWGEEYQVEINNNQDDILVYSQKYSQIHHEKHGDHSSSPIYLR